MQDFWTQNNCFLLQSAVQSFGLENPEKLISDYPWDDFSATFFDKEVSSEDLAAQWKKICDKLKLDLQKYKMKYSPKLIEFFVPYPAMKGFSDTADQVLPNLWISSCSIIKDINALHSNSITAVVNCASLSTGLSPQNYEANNINYLCLDITDVQASKDDMMSKLKQALQFIDQQEVVVVNCAAGVSRSATVVLAWLMSRKKMTLFDAFAFLRSKRRFVYPNKGFWELLISLDQAHSVPKEALEMHGQVQQVHLKIN